jgi:lantibiotic biosynthesis protein
MQTLKASSFFLLRTPTFSLDKLFALHEISYDMDEKMYAEKFKEKFKDQQFQEAILVASPELYKALNDWFNGNSIVESKQEKLILSLYKYYSRMSSRCTPYGLFAGCSLGKFTSENRIIFKGDRINAKSRLDMNYVAELANYFNQQDEVKEELVFYPNDTLYRFGDRYRFYEYNVKNKSRKYKISSIKHNLLLEQLLKISENGKSYSVLVDFLLDNGLLKKEADKYINQLIEFQILISELHPTVTGNPFFNDLVNLLKEKNLNKNGLEILLEVDELVNLYPKNEAINKRLKVLLDNLVTTDSKDLVQTDLFFNTESCQLDECISNQLIRDIQDLIDNGGDVYIQDLDSFIKKFIAKYEDKEVSLLQVLDSEAGIGYGEVSSGNTEYAPLIQQLDIPPKKSPQKYTWDSGKDLVIKKFNAALEKGLYTIKLEAADLITFKKKEGSGEVPASLYAFGSLLSKSNADLNDGNFKFLLNTISGPSAGNLLARFGHGSTQLTHELRHLLEQEELAHEDTILAEIVHLPEARTGNVLMHPILRKYEIPILGRASVEKDFQISLSDIYISVKAGKVVLRSKRLNKRIIPRLTNAHNYAKGLPVYKFLCDLQFQGVKAYRYWDWLFLSKEPFVPRIEYGKIILARAKWYLKRSDFQLQFGKAIKDLKALTDYFSNLRFKWKIPKVVVILEGDNELVINIDTPIGIKLLAEKLQKKDVELTEFLYDQSGTFLQFRDESYTNEIIIPLINNIKFKSETIKPSYNEISTPINKSFPPGSEWVYLKIYTGNKTSDKILCDFLLPLIEKLNKEGVIEKWFFVRYNDPDFHLRVRFFHSCKPDFWKDVLEIFHSQVTPFLNNGLIHKILIDTYEREINRYGINTMVMTENLFAADSWAVIKFLNMIEGDEGEKYRWLFAMLSIDVWLDCFGYSLEQKHNLISLLLHYFHGETNRMNNSKSLMVSLNNRYRKYTSEINWIMSRSYDDIQVEEAAQIFYERSVSMEDSVNKVKCILAKENNPEDSLKNLMASYLHMNLNRFFLIKPRVHETVIYHHLNKYYASIMARSKSKAECIYN